MTEHGPSEPGGDSANGTAFGAGRPADAPTSGAFPDDRGEGLGSEATQAGEPPRDGERAQAAGEAGPAAADPEGSEAPDAAPVDTPVDDLVSPDLAEVDPVMALTRERDDYRDALIRLQADFENYKKRMIKQQTDHLERAATALVDKLLPVLDTADLALAHGGGEDVKQISGALANVLEREGLERIDPVGERFDPTVHDAVAHEPSDDGNQEVVEVMRAGYRWKGRVLRPAMVKVRG
jgi:molecular chaperone GrpE